MRTVRIGSRESRLAVIQSEMVRDYLREQGLEAQILTMKTTGDIILDRTLDQIGGKGLFVKELDKALLEGKSDLSVHSLKDLPMEVPKELPVVAYSPREDPRDVLILPKGAKELDPSKPIGSSSLRRCLQLEKLFPGIPLQKCAGKCSDPSAQAGQRGIQRAGSRGGRREKTGTSGPDFQVFPRWRRCFPRPVREFWQFREEKAWIIPSCRDFMTEKPRLRPRRSGHLCAGWMEDVLLRWRPTRSARREGSPSPGFIIMRRPDSGTRIRSAVT